MSTWGGKGTNLMTHLAEIQIEFPLTRLCGVECDDTICFTASNEYSVHTPIIFTTGNSINFALH